MAHSWSHPSKCVPITGMEIQFNIFSDARLQISSFSEAIHQLPQAPFTQGAAPAQ